MSILDRTSTVARPGFNRWLVPPAAIAVHMCIGQVYGFSVFKKPLARALGITAPVAGDWSEADVGVAYSIALALLGLSAAVFGKWVERSGPRKTMLASLLCFCAGLVLTSLRRALASALAALRGLRADRRHRARARLHLAGVHLDEMVPRPAGHGHRHGHHGVRRRRADRRATG